MTAQNDSTASVVMLSAIPIRTSDARGRKLKALSCKCLSEWGDVAVYSEPELRMIVAESVANRLGISKDYVYGTLTTFSRIARPASA